MKKSGAPITVRVLPDGSVRIETDKIDDAAHVRAERFLSEVQKLLGGEATRQRRTDVHHDTHDHNHEGEHDHDHSH